MRDFWKMVRRHCLPIAVLMGICLLAALLGGHFGKPRYTATTELLFSADAGNSATDLNQASTYLERQMTSYARLVQTPVVLDPAIKKLGLDTTAQELAPLVDTMVPTTTTLLDITVTADQPQQAVEIANGIADSTVAAMEKITPTPRGGSGAVKATVIARAVDNGESGRLSLLARLLLGLVVGSALSAALVALLNMRDRRLHGAEELQRLVQCVPVIPGTAQVPGAARELAPGRSTVPDDVRRVRSALQSAWPALGAPAVQGFVLAVTSPRGSGHAALASSLADSFAETGRRVLLLDADASRPSTQPGLGEVLRGRLPLARALQTTTRDGVAVLPTGAGLDGADRLGGRQMADLVAQAAQEHDVVVLNAPQVDEGADAEDLARLASGVAVSVDLGRVRADEVRSAVNRLQAARPGAVVILANDAGRVDA